MPATIREQELQDCINSWLEFLKPESPVEHSMICFLASQDWLLQRSLVPLKKRQESLAIANMTRMLKDLRQFRRANPPPRPAGPATTGKVIEMPKRPISAVSTFPAHEDTIPEPRIRRPEPRRANALDMRRDAA
jgi:hypothetical protein